MKPTGRFYTFVVVAFMMYLFANQTQVAWLYVTSAFVAGVIPVAWLLNAGALRRLIAERQINDGDPFAPLHEADEVQIALRVRAAPRRPAAQLYVTETCPLLAPDDPTREANVFVPMLPTGNAVTINYEATIYQRGLYHFPAVQVRTKVPFGLFQRRATLNAPTSVLVYPEVRQLNRLDFLDRQPAAQITQQRAGLGTEVIGVRGYRPGDSPRHIHWRSVARTGQLVSKEFAEETQPGVSIVIDRYLEPGAGHHPKYNPFELGVKAAVSVAEYAMRRRYPVYVHADDEGFSVPYGAITWDALMQYTARLTASSEPRLGDVLEAGGLRQYVVVVVAYPTVELLTRIVGLKYSGANVLAVVPVPGSFPVKSGTPALADALREEGIDVVALKHGEDWPEAFASRPQVVS